MNLRKVDQEPQRGRDPSYCDFPVLEYIQEPTLAQTKELQALLDLEVGVGIEAGTEGSPGILLLSVFV